MSQEYLQRTASAAIEQQAGTLVLGHWPGIKWTSRHRDFGADAFGDVPQLATEQRQQVVQSNHADELADIIYDGQPADRQLHQSLRGSIDPLVVPDRIDRARHPALNSVVRHSAVLRLRPELFDERVRAGRIALGHGDLRPEHICFSEEIAIFDCIEFNAEFRTLDVADELAFLAAECDFLGAECVGPQLLQAYQEQSGDRLPVVLWDFYKSYRACVRAKVAALRADQLRGEPQAKAAEEAQRHLALADKYAAPLLSPLVG